MRCTENSNTCSQHWSTERVQQRSTTRLTTNTSKVEQIGLRSLASSAIFTDFSPANYYVFKRLRNFLQGKHFHNQKEAENAFQEFIESQGSDFYAIGINKCFLLEKNVLIVMVLINKDVFEPSYNDLKLMVQNYNYICTDLIRSYKSWPHLHLTISNNLCVTASTQRESTTRLKCVPDRDYNTWKWSEVKMRKAYAYLNLWKNYSHFRKLFPLSGTLWHLLSCSTRLSLHF